jgi:hypothetical protein
VAGKAKEQEKQKAGKSGKADTPGFDFPALAFPALRFSCPVPCDFRYVLSPARAD